VREIDALPKKERQRIARRIQSLSDQPRPQGCEKLSGEDKYRIRQGDYRIVYSISDQDRTVVVVKVGHRREVYRHG
jgi:mRNA interferase RelE/StbE